MTLRARIFAFWQIKLCFDNGKSLLWFAPVSFAPFLLSSGTRSLWITELTFTMRLFLFTLPAKQTMNKVPDSGIGLLPASGLFPCHAQPHAHAWISSRRSLMYNKSVAVYWFEQILAKRVVFRLNQQSASGLVMNNVLKNLPWFTLYQIIRGVSRTFFILRKWVSRILTRACV